MRFCATRSGRRSRACARRATRTGDGDEIFHIVPARGFWHARFSSYAETVPRAPSLPPRSGGEGGAAPKATRRVGGYSIGHCNRKSVPPPPTPPHRFASLRGGRGAERPC